MTQIDIVIPIFNPHPNWVPDFKIKYTELLPLFNFEKLNLIIVDDGSTQNFDTETAAQLESLPNTKVVRLAKNLGKGGAIREGFKITKSEYVIFTDVDFPFSNKSVYDLYKKLKDNNDVVCGFRANLYYTRVPIQRKIVSLAFRLFLRKVLGLSITDTQCGLKGFSRKGVAAMLATQTNSFLFDLEMLILAQKSNLNISKSIVDINPGTKLYPLSFKVLMRELINFIKILSKNV